MAKIELMQTSEVARRLGISSSMVIYLANQGRLSVAQKAGRMRLFDKREVEAVARRRARAWLAK